MTGILDILSPLYIDEDKFTLELDSVSVAIALQPMTLNINYDEADPEGAMLPIEVIVQPPTEDGTGYIQKIFRNFIPSSFTFTPINAGDHLVLVKELGHNRWQGRLLITIEGDEASKVESVERV